MLATGEYFFSIMLGMLIFQKEIIPISPQKIPMLKLLLHNSATAGLIILLGVISFGILGNLTLIANGIILGRIIIGVFNNYGISPIISNIAPHFFFEMLALIIATSLSCETNKLLYNIKHTENKTIRLKYAFVGACLSICLLTIAAGIESNLGG